MSGILWLFSILQFGLGGYLLVTGYRDEFEGILGWAFLTGGCILIASGFTSIGMAFVIQKLEGIRKVLSGSVRKPQNVAAAAVAGAGRPPLPPPGGRAPARETPTHAEPPVFPPPPVPPVPPTTQAEPPVFPPPPVPPESFSTVEPSREEQPADSAPPPSFPWLRPQPVVKETEEPLFPADSFHESAEPGESRAAPPVDSDDAEPWHTAPYHAEADMAAAHESGAEFPAAGETDDTMVTGDAQIDSIYDEAGEGAGPQSDDSFEPYAAEDAAAVHYDDSSGDTAAVPDSPPDLPMYEDVHGLTEGSAEEPPEESDGAGAGMPEAGSDADGEGYSAESEETRRPMPDSTSPEVKERVIVGQHEAGGNRYIMYDDGSIDAETSHGSLHFESIEEMKVFIARTSRNPSENH